MARGHQKIQSQQKAQEAAAKRKKQEGHSASAQKNAAAAALKASCSVCKVIKVVNVYRLPSKTQFFRFHGSIDGVNFNCLFLGPDARSKDVQATF